MPLNAEGRPPSPLRDTRQTGHDIFPCGGAAIWRPEEAQGVAACGQGGSCDRPGESWPLPSARLVWYHDHAHDITRLNAYAGIASAYIIRDSFEGNLRNRACPTTSRTVGARSRS